MFRSPRSRWNDEDDDRSLPTGERPSGVRRRAEPPPVDARPCTTIEEVDQRYRKVLMQRIYRRLGSHTEEGADDVLQEAYIRLDRRFPPGTRMPDPILPTLSGLVDDALLNHVRARKRRRNGGEPDEEMPSSQPDPEQIAGDAEGRAELRRDVCAVFLRMSPDEVQTLTLAHMCEVPGEELARNLGITEKALWSRLFRARRKFRELYLHLYGSGERRE